MTELQQALRLVWSYQDELHRRAQASEDKKARRLYRNSVTALGRAARPFVERPASNEVGRGLGEVDVEGGAK